MTDFSAVLSETTKLSDRCQQRLDLITSLGDRDTSDPKNLKAILTTLSFDAVTMSATLELIVATLNDARAAGRI
ncbi:hypothetical protein [Devosia sp.]|uniref:hypothetical protein n=1 Tax=Devosia sp. TaxID=1871048 RepID=UPI001AC3C055|nr:hypothetical protein [Devosia sp.]MBN9333481.1 hypothetical protein [Devosia sp.]